MRLDGSCHCEAVRFALDSHTPQPFMRCYCSICRKTAGGGGYAINIMGDAATLKVRGAKNVAVYHARMKNKEGKFVKRSSGQRHFCVKCASALWIYDPEWPELVHPFASAIDTPLPKAAGGVEIMLDYAAPWAEVPKGRGHVHFREYPKQSIEDWHKKRGLTVK